MDTLDVLSMDDVQIIITGLVGNTNSISEHWKTTPIAERFQLTGNLDDDKAESETPRQARRERSRSISPHRSDPDCASYYEQFDKHPELPDSEVLNMIQNWSTRYTNSSPRFEAEADQQKHLTRSRVSVLLRGKHLEATGPWVIGTRNAKRVAALLLILKLDSLGEEIMRFKRKSDKEKRQERAGKDRDRRDADSDRDREREREREREKERDRDERRDELRVSDRDRRVLFANAIPVLNNYIQALFRAGSGVKLTWHTRRVKPASGGSSDFWQARVKVPQLNDVPSNKQSAEGQIRNDAKSAKQDAAFQMILQMKAHGHFKSHEISETTMRASEVSSAPEITSWTYDEWAGDESRHQRDRDRDRRSSRSPKRRSSRSPKRRSSRSPPRASEAVRRRSPPARERSPPRRASSPSRRSRSPPRRRSSPKRSRSPPRRRSSPARRSRSPPRDRRRSPPRRSSRSPPRRSSRSPPRDRRRPSRSPPRDRRDGRYSGLGTGGSSSSSGRGSGSGSRISMVGSGSLRKSPTRSRSNSPHSGMEDDDKYFRGR